MFRKNTLKKKSSLLLIATLVLALVLVGPIQASAYEPNENSESIESFRFRRMEKLLPHKENYMWNYIGSWEYGHQMMLYDIHEYQDKTEYIARGTVYDLSGGIVDKDFSLEVIYTVKPEVIVQEIDSKEMSDSQFDKIELIRYPLTKGTEWVQEVKDRDGNIVTLESEIIDVTRVDGKQIYTVLYKDRYSAYYEIRKIKDGQGVTFFEKSLMNREDPYKFQYRINKDETGYRNAADFKDIPNKTWYEEPVNELLDEGIVNGYTNNTFKPQEFINVAEFIKLTMEALGYEEETGEEEWYSNYLERAKKMGVVEEGQFDKYENNITREEMARIVVEALEINAKTGSTRFYDDHKIGREFKPYVKAAASAGVLEGYPADNTYKPKKFVTRAEASKVISIIIDGLENKDKYTWREYNNYRFNYSINIPDEWPISEYYRTDKGIELFENNEEIEMKVFAEYYEKQVTTPELFGDLPKVEEMKFVLDSGEEAHMFVAKAGDKIIFNVVYIEGIVRYEFLAEMPEEFYEENKDKLVKTVSSFKVLPSDGDNEMHYDFN